MCEDRNIDICPFNYFYYLLISVSVYLSSCYFERIGQFSAVPIPSTARKISLSLFRPPPLFFGASPPRSLSLPLLCCNTSGVVNVHALHRIASHQSNSLSKVLDLRRSRLFPPSSRCPNVPLIDVSSKKHTTQFYIQSPGVNDGSQTDIFAVLCD